MTDRKTGPPSQDTVQPVRPPERRSPSPRPGQPARTHHQSALDRHAVAKRRNTHRVGQRMLHASDGVRLVVRQAARRSCLPRLVRIHLAHTVVSALLFAALNIASCCQEIQHREDHGGLRWRELGDAAQAPRRRIEFSRSGQKCLRITHRRTDTWAHGHTNTHTPPAADRANRAGLRVVCAAPESGPPSGPTQAGHATLHIVHISPFLHFPMVITDDKHLQTRIPLRQRGRFTCNKIT